MTLIHTKNKQNSTLIVVVSIILKTETVAMVMQGELRVPLETLDLIVIWNFFIIQTLGQFQIYRTDANIVPRPKSHPQVLSKFQNWLCTRV